MMVPAVYQAQSSGMGSKCSSRTRGLGVVGGADGGFGVGTNVSFNGLHCPPHPCPCSNPTSGPIAGLKPTWPPRSDLLPFKKDLEI